MPRKVENYRMAVARLREALEEYAKTPASTVLRDGVIQRFEFTFELAWKSLREYMEDQGSTAQMPFSKAVFQNAYAAGLIDDEQGWLDMLQARNLTSHVYSDDQAARVAADIQTRYMPALEALARRYGES